MFPFALSRERTKSGCEHLWRAGQQVMLDFDLAMLYGEKTSRLNEQVKRNIERFPDDFMFQLTKAEQDYLRTELIESNSLMSQNVMLNLSENQQDTDWISQNATSNSIKKGFRKLPYAFTRNGIAMLSSVLRSKTAIEVNKRIIRYSTNANNANGNPAIAEMMTQ